MQSILSEVGAIEDDLWSRNCNHACTGPWNQAGWGAALGVAVWDLQDMLPGVTVWDLQDVLPSGKLRTEVVKRGEALPEVPSSAEAATLVLSSTRSLR